MAGNYDVAIIGSGINALVCAALLSKRGKRVLVLERNDQLGGCLRTEELTAPGFLHDVMATTFVLFRVGPANAALGDDDRLRWFDFEYSGIRHGAEDLAWLLGDEVWPVSPEDMLDIITDAYDPALGHGLDAYLDYLALYTTFHCIQRLQLVVRESEKRGWQSMRRIRKYDDAGVHPQFAAHLCRVGALFARRNTLTAPIARDFEEAEQVFVTLLRDGMKQKMLEKA